MEVVFVDELRGSEIVDVNKGVSNRICEVFEVKAMVISKSGSGMMYVAVDLEETMLKYRFAKKESMWRINHYEKEYKEGVYRGA